MKKVFNFIEKHEKIIFLILLILFCVLYYSIYLFTTFPITQGWGQFYSGLFTSGKIPYNDFYYYLPPLNLFLDTFIWKLASGHFIIYQLIRLVERIIILLLIYNLLCKKFKPRNSFIGTAIGAIIFSATVYDIVGDYNQTTVLFAVLLTTIYYNYFECINKKSDSKKQYLYLLCSGFLIGLSFFFKQTLIVSESLIMFPFLTFFILFNKRKNYFKSLGISLIGIFSPIIIGLLFMYSKGVLNNFLEQVYLGDSGKGTSLLDIILTIVKSCINLRYIIFSLFVVVYISIKNKLYIFRDLKDETIKYISLIFGLICTLAFISCFSNRVGTFEIVLKSKIGLLFMLLNILLLVIDYYVSKKGKENNQNSLIMSFIIFVFNLLFMAILLIKSSTTILIYNYTSTFGFVTDICNIIVIGNILLFLYFLYKYYKNRDMSTLLYMLIIAGGIIYAYNQSMSSTDQIPNHGCIFLGSFLIAFLLEKYEKGSRIIKYATYAVISMLVIFVSAQKISCAYSWWGWSEDRITSNKKYTINVPGLEGYRVTKNKKQMYEKMYKVIKENTDENSVIYGYPHVKVFNVLLNNYNLDTFVPVLWYDVCSNSYAELEAKELKKNYPDIFVWVDIPDALETHEEVFRKGGKLTQRKIMKWFAKEVKNKNYVLVGQYDNIFVYKLDDGSEIKYKYIKNKKTKNKTLNQFIKKKKKKTTKEKEDE